METLGVTSLAWPLGVSVVIFWFAMELFSRHMNRPISYSLFKMHTRSSDPNFGPRLHKLRLLFGG